MNRHISYFILLFSLFYAPLFSETPPNILTSSSEISNPVKNDTTPPQETSPTSVPTMHNFGLEFVKMLVILGIIIALLLFLSNYMKRFMQSKILQMNESSNIKVLDSRNISQRTIVHLVDIEGVQFALAESHTGTILLGKINGDQHNIVQQSPK